MNVWSTGSSRPRGFGERMAARWLDASRYADTQGYQNDAPVQMWRWRDWVIDAFNANKPFDEFTIEQIAGDLLPDRTLDQLIATGFNRNHRSNSELGIVDEEYRVEYVVDRVETMSTVFLGLTVGCARCHDHKYDPISQKEFYQLYAYFNNVPERGRVLRPFNSPPRVAAPTREETRQLDEMARRIAPRREGVSGEAPLRRGRVQGVGEPSLAVRAGPRIGIRATPWRLGTTSTVTWDLPLLPVGSATSTGSSAVRSRWGATAMSNRRTCWITTTTTGSA